MTTIYYRFEPDRIIEVLNSTPDPTHDALVTRDLDTAERARYDRLKADGCSDARIFADLHGCTPATPPDRLSVPIHLLSREQLAWLIGERLGRRIRGLASLEREDLLAVLGGLYRRHQRVG